MIPQKSICSAQLATDLNFAGPIVHAKAYLKMDFCGKMVTTPGDFLSDAGFLNLENFQPLARFKVRKLQ